MKLKGFVLITFILLFTSGCIKMNNEMTINSDKTVVLSVDILLAEDLKDVLGMDFESNYDDLSKKGFKVDDINKDGYIGKRITVNYANIDDISDSKQFDVTINSFYEDDFNKKNIFKVETGFLQNTYTAKLSYDTSSTDMDNEDYEGMVDSSELTPEQEALMKEMESTFTVNLPSKSISNNATAVSNEGKKLMWDFIKEPNKNIEFTFKMWNTKNLYITLGCGGVFVLFLLVLTIVLIKRHRNSVKSILKHGPIHTDYDPSIEAELNAAPDNLELAPNQMMDVYDGPTAKSDNLEYSLPEEEAAKVAAQTPAPKPKMFVGEAENPDIEFIDL